MLKSDSLMQKLSEGRLYFTHIFCHIFCPGPVGIVEKGAGAPGMLFKGAAFVCSAGEGSGQSALTGA